MFLSLLNDDEKKVFGSLISKVAVIDGKLAEEEKDLLENYKVELKMDKLDEMDIDFDDAVDVLSSSNENAKRAVFLEIVSLILSDEEVTTKETELIENISKKFGIEKDKYQFVNTVKDLQKIYGELFDLVYID